MDLSYLIMPLMVKLIMYMQLMGRHQYDDTHDSWLGCCTKIIQYNQWNETPGVFIVVVSFFLCGLGSSQLCWDSVPWCCGILEVAYFNCWTGLFSAAINTHSQREKQIEVGIHNTWAFTALPFFILGLQTMMVFMNAQHFLNWLLLWYLRMARALRFIFLCLFP